MENSNMKNMVILKNLPSNIVEEAIVILKSNKKVKKLEKIDKPKSFDNNEKNSKDKEYILKEAEMIVNSYVSNVEKSKEKYNIRKNKKYIYIRRYNIVITAIAIIEFIGLLVS